MPDYCLTKHICPTGSFPSVYFYVFCGIWSSIAQLQQWPPAPKQPEYLSLLQLKSHHLFQNFEEEHLEDNWQFLRETKHYLNVPAKMPSPVQQFGSGKSNWEVSLQFLTGWGFNSASACFHVSWHCDCTWEHSSWHMEDGGRGCVKFAHGGR